MSVRTLVQYLSNHLCTELIQTGLIAATLTITGATNASPIVITTAMPHQLLPNAAVYITGVTGNTAANDFWSATPIDATHFALQGSAANGNYISGGTVQTALIGGKILLGRWWVQQNQVRPRIVAIPVEAPILPRDQYAMVNSVGTTPAQTTPPADGLSDPQRAALIAPAVAVTHNVFEIQCWGGQTPPDQDYDFDYTELLRDQVIRSADELFRGNYTVSGGKWVDQQEKATTEMKIGHVLMFYLTIDAPVTVVPQAFAPPGTGFVIDVFGNNTGTDELAIEIDFNGRQTPTGQIGTGESTPGNIEPGVT